MKEEKNKYQRVAAAILRDATEYYYDHETLEGYDAYFDDFGISVKDGGFQFTPDTWLDIFAKYVEALAAEGIKYAADLEEYAREEAERMRESEYDDEQAFRSMLNEQFV